MLEVLVVTHPEATHHTEHRVGGWFDSDLTPRGLAEADRISEEVASRLRGVAGVALFTSDLRRTARTADAVAARLGIPATPVPGLREKSYGEGEGQPDAWFRERFVPPPADGERMDHDEGLVGAETKLVWATRVYRAMDEVIATPEPVKVVVTHGGTATFVLAHWIGMPLEAAGRVSFPVSPGSITHLQEDDYFHNRAVVSLNDTSHLSDETTQPGSA